MMFALSRGVCRCRYAFGLLLALLVVCGASGVMTPRDAEAEPTARRAWLGIELDRSLAGAVVAKHVILNSPAAKAGIVDGDVLLSADDTQLDDPKQLVARVALLGPKGTLNIRVRHGSAERTVVAQLVAHPGSEQILRLDKVGTFAPNWKSTVPAVGSLPANIHGLRGKVVLVDFWATWCGPCRLISPQLSRWQTAFGAQGFTVVGITTDAVSVAAQGAQAMNMRYAVISDTSEATSRAYGVNALPTMFLIDKKGVIRDVLVGYDPSRHKEIEQQIQRLIAEPASMP